MGNELVSVVLCTYNGMAFIDDQVKTICNQTYTNLEIIIVDDHSTDGTYEKLKTHSAKDPRIRLFQNEKNVGFNLNFNRACSLTTGSYIAIADQDDVWELNKIEVLLNEIDRDENIVLVHSISARFEKDNKPSIKSVRLVDYFEGNDVKKFFMFNSISGHNMLARKRLIEAALPFPSTVYYDWWLAAIACSIGEISHVNKILVWHRMHETNATGAGKPILPFYKQIQTILPVVLEKGNIKKADKTFGEKLLNFYKQFPEKKFSFPLFTFLLMHAKTVFAHKKRKLPWFSYIKGAFKYSLRSSKA